LLHYVWSLMMKLTKGMRLRAVLLAVLLPTMAQAAGLSVVQPWIRFLLPSLPAAGYLVLQNDTDSDETLTGASSPACQSLMVHESKDDSGVAMMMMVPSLVIPAHGKITFAPGGYHLMCMGPKMRVGETVPVTLMLKPSGSLRFMAQVYGATTAP